ncbi:MAG TPA: 3-dehydroquinate synthase [Deltaproteobacteria bacterium]|nr:3-dehydroquinate synthase [Deltaproteobacteria bacterium]HXK47103.1 3-dehydroquinate synthase [Deltaproteobacteria bacterium]
MIFLTGFMGAGKTTAGRRLAERLGCAFFDLDEEICSRTRSSVREIFGVAGESAFRVLEHDALLDVAGRGIQAVVATGGGLPVDPANRAVMKASGYIVHLRAGFETLSGRVPEDSARPLWDTNARSLLQERTPAYDDADFIVDTDGLSPGDVVDAVAGWAHALPDPVPVLAPSSPYPVHIGSGIIPDMRRYLSRHLRPEGLFALVDEQVMAHHGSVIRSCLTGTRNAVVTVPSGEASKSFDFLKNVLDEMFSAQANRQWICLAIGGGVTGDLAAFASSIFMRGIPVVQVPTTLLAQVDSGIGGKTGIDVRQGKNLVGTFHQPLLVVSDTAFLDTLDASLIRDAMAEVIKYGIIMDTPLFEYLEAAGDLDYLKVVTMCVRDKASVVSRDEREGGLRRTLNFGHTLGHAVEHAHGFAMSHGRAVSAGMYFAVWLSRELGLVPPKEADRIFRLVRKHAYPLEELDYPHPDRIGESIFADKKSTGEGIHFVLTPGVGDVTVKKLTGSQILGAYGRFVRESAEGLR